MNFTKQRILAICYAAAFVVVLAGFAVQGQLKASAQEVTLSNSYNRALSDLVEHLDGVQSALTKANYAGSAEMLTTISAKLTQEAGYAKQAVAVLPIQDLNLTNTYKFLSQVGDYAASLAKRMAAGETLTDEDRASLTSLQDYAARLYEEVLVLQDEAVNGSVSWEDISLDDVGEFTAGLTDFEESFSDYPTLIYDGPFSDHILERTPRMTEGQNEISQEAALSIAAAALGVSADTLTAGSNETGQMECYTFTDENGTVSAAVTKAGGYLSYTLNGRTVGEAAFSNEEGGTAAAEALEKIGYSGMTASYYEESGGVLTCNFAYQEGEYLCYTDLIKVEVALDTGEVIGVDARGFLVNHAERGLEESRALTEAQAKEVLSPLLTVESSRLCVIPSDGLSEIPCYEFLCTAGDGTEVLVYVRTDTPTEEKILILLTDSHGTLTI